MTGEMTADTDLPPARPFPGAREAAELLLGRVTATAGELGELFPLYADPATGRWRTSRRGSWAGGFWAGLLWLAAARSGDPADRGRAAACTARLRPRAADDTDARAMIFWYGAAAGHRLCGDDGAAAIALEGAAALADSRRELGPGAFVPAGTALGRGPRGAVTLTVDAAAAVTALLGWAGRTAGRADWTALARQHAAAVAEHCVDGDGAVRASAVPREGAAGHPPAGRWSRGQAWGMLALATAAAVPDPGPDFGAAACRTADWWLDRTAGGVPPWSFADPDGLRDTSAAAIAAEALLVLAEVLGEPRGAGYREAAADLLRTLAERHLTRPAAGAGGAAAPPAGMLLDGCYDRESGTAVAHELVWGDHFLLAALLRPAGG
ncbi:sugar ABC transporter permease [Streptomyces sp. TRM 70361]|uniref:sugar ABC transporter permease n=1 Tax=Streptomyces sp. TRM 70361 TaxID=3116553 RepID=UPI002E7B1E72|nr:sugar ABC transporter permease [Streptomyces sp. TRM 70361]MEE1938040.1 sugar ABC transporter permease [Streptomyces sp. TRM 70361]